MGHVFKPHWSHQRVNMEKCRAAVHDDCGVGFHQCGRKGIIERDGMLWCKTHDPEAVAARRAKQEARWAKEQAEWKRNWAIERLRAKSYEAIKQIAEGHNDPRGLALEVLASETIE